MTVELLLRPTRFEVAILNGAFPSLCTLKYAKTSCFNPVKPSGYYIYRQFNIQQFYVLPTQCIYVFCVDLRTKRLFPYTALTDWFL